MSKTFKNEKYGDDEGYESWRERRRTQRPERNFKEFQRARFNNRYAPEGTVPVPLAPPVPPINHAPAPPAPPAPPVSDPNVPNP